MTQEKHSQSIAITMGCPVGIGPEIILKAHKELLNSGSRPIVVGDMGVLQNCAQSMGLPVDIVRWQPGLSCDADSLYVCEVPVLEGGKALVPNDLHWGEPDLATGQAMASYIVRAVQGIQRGEFDAVVTCPITKKALNAAGFMYPGHTEMLADLCHSDDYAMMMAGKSLRVTLVTIHQALNKVANDLSVAAIERLIALTHQALQEDFGIKDPVIAVAGLNPHAGEDGLFGREEIECIAPAVEKAKRYAKVMGPFPPDTLFHQAARGRLDAVVCMYHDQGLIPFKLLHFADGVNVTIGLPIVRTSVDHGTAYDIAGKGVANPESLVAAYQMAEEIVRNRRRWDLSSVAPLGDVVHCE